MVAVQRVYLDPDDDAPTGVLKMGDLRAYLESRTG